MTDEKRLHERVTAHRILVRVPAIDRLRGQYLKDLSAGGLFIKTHSTVPLGAEVAIELLPFGSDAPFGLRGRVVRVLADEASAQAGTAGVGVEIEQLTSEAAERLNALVAECRQPPALDPEVDKLISTIQSMLFEQGVLRDALAGKEKQLAQKERAVATASPGAAELKAVRQQVLELTTELAGARERSRGLQQDLAIREDECAGSRAAAERLVAEKAALTIELGRLERDRDERAHELAVHLESKGDLESALEELEQAQRTAESARAALAAEKAKLEEALTLERSSRGEAEAKARAADRLARDLETALTAEKAARAEAERGLDALVDQQRGAAAQLEASLARAARLKLDLADQVQQTERLRARERELRAQLGLSAESAVAPEEPANEEEPEEVITSPGIEIPEPEGSSRALLEFSEFVQRLRSGARVVRASDFCLQPPVDSVEAALAGHLETQDSIDGLVRASGGRYSRERVAQVLFALYKRAAIELR